MRNLDFALLFYSGALQIGLLIGDFSSLVKFRQRSCKISLVEHRPDVLAGMTNNFISYENIRRSRICAKKRYTPIFLCSSNNQLNQYCRSIKKGEDRRSTLAAGAFQARKDRGSRAIFCKTNHVWESALTVSLHDQARGSHLYPGWLHR